MSSADATGDRAAIPESVAAALAREEPNPLGRGRFHYAGLGGSGMSALAQFQTMLGGRAAAATARSIAVSAPSRARSSSAWASRSTRRTAAA